MLSSSSSSSSSLLLHSLPPSSSSTSTTSFPLLIRRGAAKKAAPPPPKRKTAAFSKKGSSASSAEGAGEGKNESLRKVLYGDDASARKAHDLARQAALERAIPSPEAHSTIQRAWSLLQLRKREAHERELRLRYDSMRAAIAHLEQVSPGLAEQATGGRKFDTVRGTRGEEGKRASLAGRIEGLFPRQMPVLK